MKDFSCPKCGSVNVYVENRGLQNALMCHDCESWIKWIGKKEIVHVNRFVDEMSQIIDEPSCYEVRVYNNQTHTVHCKILTKGELNLIRRCEEVAEIIGIE